MAEGRPIDHAVAWLDFRRAKIFLLRGDASLSNAGGPVLIHDRRPTIGNVNETQGRGGKDFFDDVLGALETSRRWIVIGNRSNCLGLLKRICDQRIEDRVVSVEMIALSTDEDILARARDHLCRLEIRSVDVG